MSGSRQAETESEGGDEQGVGLVEEAPIDLAERKIQELEARLRTVSSAYKEKVDEIDRVKDRLNRQAVIQEEIRRGEVVATLFEPVENLHRSLPAVRDVTPDAVRGLEMVHAQFMAALHKLGLEEVPGVGSRFDPNVHEAIMSQPVAEKEKDNTVLSVFSAGYRIGTRTIRPARVVIGSYTAEVAEA